MAALDMGLVEWVSVGQPDVHNNAKFPVPITSETRARGELHTFDVNMNRPCVPAFEEEFFPGKIAKQAFTNADKVVSFLFAHPARGFGPRQVLVLW